MLGLDEKNQDISLSKIYIVSDYNHDMLPRPGIYCNYKPIKHSLLIVHIKGYMAECVNQ